MLTDLDEASLRSYRSSQVAPADFDEFWAGTLAASRAVGSRVEVVSVGTELTTLDVYDVTFAGFNGEPIRAWLRLPRHRTAALPAVVQYIGYGGGRGSPLELLLWASAGYAHLVMDTRGQGSTGMTGDTPDIEGSGPQHPGFTTRGIESPETYYYRRLITDAVRAVDAVREIDMVDPTRVAVLGGSQGGGLALAVAGLVPDLSAVIAHVPFMCDFPRAIRITDDDPYGEIGRYLLARRRSVESVERTLSYFDAVNFGPRATAPAWFSTALMDTVCPPSTVFGAFNSYGGPKEIAVWPFNRHEGGGILDDTNALRALAAEFAR